MNELAFTKNLIQNAGQLILGMKKEAKISFKSPKDIVTEADLACEGALVQQIREQYPSDQIISEESYNHFTLTNERTWVIDPIDGTVNYSRGIPLYGISIALIENKEVLLGLIHLPEMKELYWAVKGKGAFCNDRPIQASNVDCLEKSLIYTKDFNTGVDSTGQERSLTQMAGNTFRTRILGSVVIEAVYVASGKAEAQISNGFFWDLAAAKLILEEAGGCVTQMNGNSYDPQKRNAVLTNGRIHQELLQLLQSVDPQP